MNQSVMFYSSILCSSHALLFVFCLHSLSLFLRLSPVLKFFNLNVLRHPSEPFGVTHATHDGAHEDFDRAHVRVL